jgi:hypothetical protein
MIRTLRKMLCISMALVAIVLTVTAVASAQWDPYPWKRVPRTPDGKVDLNASAQSTPYGKPDLSGFWMPDDPVKHLLNLAADLKPEDVPLKPWARELYNRRIENNGKDHPGVSCLPSGIPEKDNIPDGLKLVQTEDLVLLLHESRTIYRQIFTDGRPLPKNPQPTWMGYSIGHWDKNTFVVETIGQNGKTWLDMRGLPGTEALRVTDRGHHRRSGGIHAAVDRQARLDPAGGYRSHREHLRREQPGPGAYGGKVTPGGLSPSR